MLLNGAKAEQQKNIRNSQDDATGEETNYFLQVS